MDEGSKGFPAFRFSGKFQIHFRCSGKFSIHTYIECSTDNELKESLRECT